MTRLFLSFLLAAIALLGWLGSCTPTDEQITSVPTFKPVLADVFDANSIALLVPYESEIPEWNVLATNLEQGARLALEDLGIGQGQLTVYATGGRVPKAKLAMQAALDDGADAVLGPAFSVTTKAVAPLADATSVPVFSFSNDRAVAGGNVTILGQSFQNLSDRLVGHAVQRGMRTAIIVSENTKSGEAAREALLAAATKYGQSVPEVVNHEFSQMGIVDAIGRVLEAAENYQPDIIYFTGNSAGSLPVITRLLDDRNLRNNGIQYAGISRWDIPPAALEHSAFQGAWFPLPDPVLVNRFSARYEAHYGTLPHPFALLGYDSVAVVHALSTNRRISRRRGAQEVVAVRGASGELRLSPGGGTTRNLVIGTIIDEQLEILRDHPLAVASVTLHGSEMRSNRAN